MLSRQVERRMKRKGISLEEYRIMEEEIKKESIKIATQAFAIATAMALRDKFGFGEVRLKRVIHYITENFEMINEGYVNLEDMKEILLKECKIRF